ncbi:BnaC09g20730D [Brassica napus]|uniref:BnaC09g20730D protein n=1 Tax=Brassica napus TaxID=3708 RepID=A0A078FWE3_BRANA|nr:BnaC09g20730D [Brassica napus]
MFACFCLLFLFFIERRFYGESTPFGKKSHKTTEILGYLNSQQALADCAILIRSLKQNLSSEASPVVVFGGSYGETWFRLKYPHIAIGALASSAPILQFDNIVPLTSFYDAISQDFKVLYALFAKLVRAGSDRRVAKSSRDRQSDRLSDALSGSPGRRYVRMRTCRLVGYLSDRRID